jgi:hypothetical protein
LSHADLSAAAHLSAADYLGDVPWNEDETAKDWYARVKSRPSFRSILAETVAGIRPWRPTQISTSERRGGTLKVAVGEQLPSPVCCSGAVVSPDSQHQRADRQKFHSAPCLKLRNRLCFALISPHLRCGP